MDIDSEALREQLLDECGTAFASGIGPAVLDISDIEMAGDDELIGIAERLGVDAAALTSPSMLSKAAGNSGPV